MTVSQGGNCVDGVWSSTPPGWTGAISGFASTDSFSGQFSFERTAEDGGKCSAVGSISGPVGASTLRWTSDGLTATGACAGAIPQTLVLTLQRQ
jgi:hypothetical protein